MDGERSGAGAFGHGVAGRDELNGAGRLNADRDNQTDYQSTHPIASIYFSMIASFCTAEMAIATPAKASDNGRNLELYLFVHTVFASRSGKKISADFRD